MKVEELKHMLHYAKDSDEVVIVVNGNQLGSTPCVPIKHINIGFDWNSGKVLIVPSVELNK